jgi:hypothetical protein
MTITEKIIKEFPEFKESDYYNDNLDLPYVFIPFFGDYFRSLVINNNSLSKRAVEFINKNYNLGTDEDKNQIWIGVFEVVGGDIVLIEYLQENLSGEAKDDFQKFLNRSH